jgi:hypothetical protein
MDESPLERKAVHGSGFRPNGLRLDLFRAACAVLLKGMRRRQ